MHHLKVLLGNLDSCMQSNEIRTHPHTMHKNKLKMAESLKYKTGSTIKLLEENTGKTLSVINIMNIFSGQSPKAIEIRAKVNPWDLFKLKSFCTAKETQKKTKRHLTKWETIFSNDATDKGLSLEYINNIYNPTAKNQSINGKMGKRPE